MLFKDLFLIVNSFFIVIKSSDIIYSPVSSAVERLAFNQEVRGSNPLRDTKRILMAIDNKDWNKKSVCVVCKFCNKNLDGNSKVCHECIERERPSICFYQIAGVIVSTIFLLVCVVWLIAIIFNSDKSIKWYDLKSLLRSSAPSYFLAMIGNIFTALMIYLMALNERQNRWDRLNLLN